MFGRRREAATDVGLSLAQLCRWESRMVCFPLLFDKGKETLFGVHVWLSTNVGVCYTSCSVNKAFKRISYAWRADAAYTDEF